MRKRLVSILIPNYNYGRYLGNCLQSILDQTYENIEVIFRDNRSWDESFEVAYEYRKRFEERGIFCSIAQNRYNLGSALNSAKCFRESQGDYILYLSSDDSIRPDFVKRCVEILDRYPNVGMVITHRDEVDETGSVSKTPPFYDRDCIVPGEEQAAVFMMAGIGIPSQCMIRRSDYQKSREEAAISFTISGDWFNNFLISCYSDIAYLTDALCLYRTHSGNETTESEENLLGIFEHYQMLNVFVSVAERHAMAKPQRRYKEAVEKLGSMCLRYALKMLKNEKQDAARRYLLLAPVLKRDIVEDARYTFLMECVRLKGADLADRLLEFERQHQLNRTVSYAPPEGSIPLEERR